MHVIYFLCECLLCLCDSCESILDVTIITTIVVDAIVSAILVYPIVGWGLGRLCWHGAFPNQVRSTTTPIATEAPDGIHFTMGYTISPGSLKSKALNFCHWSSRMALENTSFQQELDFSRTEQFFLLTHLVVYVCLHTPPNVGVL